MFIKIDPDVEIGSGIPGETEVKNRLGLELVSESMELGWQFSPGQIQFRNTFLIDLSVPESVLLANMKQKTRYNIRLSSRKGVDIRVGSPADFEILYRMYAETALRAGFIIRSQSYYRQVWESFHSVGMADFLIAEVDGQPVAAVTIFRFARKAWYMYGMSIESHREKMPNYLLELPVKNT